MLRLFLILIAAILNLTAFAINPADAKAALEQMLGNHPYSTYQDIYKSFFQDSHGPGHLLADSARAKAYLLSELADSTSFRGPVVEPAGCGENFVRVNLSVIADGRVTTDDYFRAFTDGLGRISPPDMAEWRKQWSVIDSLLPSLPEGEMSRADILKQLESGNPVVHHSRKFVRESGYHYRIISRDAFENIIAPKLK